MKAIYLDSFGFRREAPVQSTFSRDGTRYFVLGPVPVGAYDTREPFDVMDEADLLGVIHDTPEDSDFPAMILASELEAYI